LVRKGLSGMIFFEQEIKRSDIINAPRENVKRLFIAFQSKKISTGKQDLEKKF
jgi:hypothetical protein